MGMILFVDFEKLGVALGSNQCGSTHAKALPVNAPPFRFQKSFRRWKTNSRNTS